MMEMGSYVQPEKHCYCLLGGVLGGAFFHVALVPVEISLEAVGESKRI
jgi:hypothetical protein